MSQQLASFICIFTISERRKRLWDGRVFTFLMETVLLAASCDLGTECPFSVPASELSHFELKLLYPMVN